jgi:hypothetical protein
MSHQSHIQSKKDRMGKARMAMVLLLSLCVLVQMLGVPVTLLNPMEAADTLADSVSEGFAVPSSRPQLTLSFGKISATDDQTSMHVPVLASAMFHPPVL